MNIYSESDSVIRKIKQGIIKAGSIVRLTHPSGNSHCVRIRGYNRYRDKMIGCDMGWDNGAAQDFSLNNAIVELVEKGDN